MTSLQGGFLAELAHFRAAYQAARILPNGYAEAGLSGTPQEPITGSGNFSEGLLCLSRRCAGAEACEGAAFPDATVRDDGLVLFLILGFVGLFHPALCDAGVGVHDVVVPLLGRAETTWQGDHMRRTWTPHLNTVRTVPCRAGARGGERCAHRRRIACSAGTGANCRDGHAGQGGQAGRDAAHRRAGARWWRRWGRPARRHA